MLKKCTLQTLLTSNTENGVDTIRTEAKGGCLIEETGLMLRYVETENQGTASLLLTDGLADLKRNGNIRSRMTFVNGKLLPCTYVTPKGDLDFSIYTYKQCFEVTATGGYFIACYTLLAAEKHVAENVLTVAWEYE